MPHHEAQRRVVTRLVELRLEFARRRPMKRCQEQPMDGRVIARPGRRQSRTGFGGGSWNKGRRWHDGRSKDRRVKSGG